MSLFLDVVIIDFFLLYMFVDLFDEVDHIFFYCFLDLCCAEMLYSSDDKS